MPQTCNAIQQHCPCYDSIISMNMDSASADKLLRCKSIATDLAKRRNLQWQNISNRNQKYKKLLRSDQAGASRFSVLLGHEYGAFTSRHIYRAVLLCTTRLPTVGGIPRVSDRKSFTQNLEPCFRSVLILGPSSNADHSVHGFMSFAWTYYFGSQRSRPTDY